MATTYSNKIVDFKLVQGIILVQATVNDEQGYLAFDTGAMQTALHRKYFSDIQGKELKIAKFSEGMKNDMATEITIHSLSFSNVTLTDRKAMLMDLSYVEDRLAAFEPSLRLLGTMGIDIIRHFSVMLDYQEGKITLNPSGRFDRYTCVPLRMEALPVVEIKIGDGQYRFVLDTGANACLLGKALQELLPVQPVEGAPNVFHIPLVSLENHEYRDVASVFADISAIQSKVSVDGVIGYQILSSQRSYFDFMNEILYLERV